MSEYKWYATALVVSSIVEGAPDVKPVIDFQVRLLKATNHEDAYQEALRLGVKEQLEYDNALSESVSWRFEGLYDLVELGTGDLKPGVEVFNLRSGNSIDEVVVEKERLTVFWLESNKSKTVAEIILEEE